MDRLRDFLPVLGEFVVKVGSLETTLDHMILQASSHFGSVFKERYKQELSRKGMKTGQGGMPKSFEQKTIAWIVLLDHFIDKPPLLSGSRVKNEDEAHHLLQNISKIRNALFHSSYVGLPQTNCGKVLEVERYKKFEKNKDAQSYILQREIISLKTLKETLRDLDFLILYAECCIAALQWNIDGWNEFELVRQKSLPARTVDLHKMTMQMSKGKSPFEVCRCQ